MCFTTLESLIRASWAVGPRATITSSLETSQHDAEKGAEAEAAVGKGESGTGSLKTLWPMLRKFRISSGQNSFLGMSFGYESIAGFSTVVVRSLSGYSFFRDFSAATGAQVVRAESGRSG